MSATTRDLEGRRILVVEDELLVAMEVEDVLQEQGCEVLPGASTVKDALARIEEYRPDLVILDRNLDGERTSKVAEELNRTRVPFIVMTGYVNGVADEPAMVGAPCIQKPWTAAELIRQLQQMLA